MTGRVGVNEGVDGPLASRDHAAFTRSFIRVRRVVEKTQARQPVYPHEQPILRHSEQVPHRRKCRIAICELEELFVDVVQTLPCTEQR